MSTYLLQPLPPPSAFFATISVITEKTVLHTNAPIAKRWLQDTHYICVCEPDAPFVSVGAILIGLAHSNSVEIAINQAMFQLTVCFRTCSQTRPLISLEMEHLSDKLQQESIVLMPGARVYERGNVMISYQSGCTFLICISHCIFFPLGLTSFTEDCYTFSLGPHSFTLKSVSLDNLTPVPLLLFTS